MNHRRRLLLALTLVAAALLTMTASNIHYTTSIGSAARAVEQRGLLGNPDETRYRHRDSRWARLPPRKGWRPMRSRLEIPCRSRFTCGVERTTCAMESALADLSKPKGLP